MTLTGPSRRRMVTAALLAPAALWLLVFLVLPFLAILVFSLGERAPEGGYQRPSRWPNTPISRAAPPPSGTR